MKRGFWNITFISLLIFVFFIRCEKESRIDLTIGLLAYYPFDGDIKDYSQNQNHGIDSTKGVYVSGIKGLAHDFNGKTDFIRLKDTINFSNGLTFSFWIKSRGFINGENNGCIISKYSMSGRRSFYVNSFGYQSQVSKNEIRVYFFPKGFTTGGQEWVGSNTTKAEIAQFSFNPDLWTVVEPTALILNTWTHCVVNCTKTDIEIWLNGKFTSSKHREHDIYFDSSEEPVIIGNILHGGEGKNNHLNGSLDELRIYNRPLTLEEIQSLYKNGRQNYY
jgi:hypothetical protein